MLQVEGDKWNPQNEICWTQLETLEDDRKLLNFKTIDWIVDQIYGKCKDWVTSAIGLTAWWFPTKHCFILKQQRTL